MIPETMRAPRFHGKGQITFEEKAIPRPESGQLLLRVGANALCGSERGQFLQGAPIVPGHEAVGEVVMAGPETHTPVGTFGAVFLMDFCGSCRSCRMGSTNQCLEKRGDMGFSRDGGYAPYELISENIFFPLGKEFLPHEVTLLLDIMGTGGHAIERGQRLHDDVTSLLVAGAGPIGLGVLAMAKILFGDAFPVLITDFVPYRLNLAERLGGRPIPLSQTSLEDGLKRHGFSGVDMVVDTTGKGAARQECLETLDKRGVMVCVGHGEGLNLDVSRHLIAPERALLGSEYFRFDELPANVERLREHRAYLSQIITHRYPGEAIQEAFELFFSGETGKVIVEP